VNPDAFHALSGGQFCGGHEMAIVGVNATGADEADQVECVVIFLSPSA
jgi:hypothetical protein